MKQWESGRVSELYVTLMCSLFLLAVSPQGYRNIAETKFAVFALLTVLFLLFFFLPRTGSGTIRKGRWHTVHFLIVAYWSWSLLSAVCSPWRLTALLGGERFDGMITITLYCAVLLILSRSGIRGHFRLWLPAAVFVVLCIISILQFLDLNPLWLYPGDLRWSGRERIYNGAFLSTIGNADLTSSVLCTGFAFFWPIGIQRGRRYLLPIAALILAVLIASGIRAGLVGASVSILICLPPALPLGRKGVRRVWLCLAMVCLCLLLFIYLYPLSGTLGELHEMMHGHAEDTFGSGRVYIWKNVWPLVKDRPILGGGPDTLGERGLAFVKIGADGALIRRTIDCAHSEPLNILVNQGLPALLLLAAAWLLTMIRSLRCRTTAAAALRSALIAYATAACFGIGMPSNDALFWLIWGMLLAEIAENGNQRFNVI